VNLLRGCVARIFIESFSLHPSGYKLKDSIKMRATQYRPRLIILTQKFHLKIMRQICWEDLFMPASYSHLAVHLIFTTKNHKTWIKKPLQPILYAYMAGIIKNLGGSSNIINGIEDHVHILCLLPKDISIGEFMSKLKANSSKWIRQNHYPDFGWQDGYAAFSVSKSNMPAVIQYIQDQEEHHHHTSANAEFEALLRKHWMPREE
jgi:REP element-mobilizing transposase RayT